MTILEIRASVAAQLARSMELYRDMAPSRLVDQFGRPFERAGQLIGSKTKVQMPYRFQGDK